MPASPKLPDRPGPALPGAAASGERPPPGALAGEGLLDLLPCGVPVAALVDQADGGRLEPADGHQAGCAHCRGALRAAAVADRALGVLRATNGPTPPGLVQRVMSRVREARQEQPPIEIVHGDAGGRGDGPAAPGPATGGRLQVAGGVRVARQVVADLARQAASGLRGVTVARATAAPRPGSPDGVDVHLGLLVDGRTPLPELARQVRQRVRAVLRRSIGQEDVNVELTALDLIEPD